MSHPVWVCGLKPIVGAGLSLIGVTPCMGVWIETLQMKSLSKVR